MAATIFAWPDRAQGDVRSGTYLVIPIKGTIGRNTTYRMQQYLKLAREIKPAAVVVEIDTHGGPTTHAEAAINLIIDHKDIRFIAFVDMALSAGVPITMACSEVYVSQKATIGAARSYTVDAWGRIMYVRPGETRDVPYLFLFIRHTEQEHRELQNDPRGRGPF